MKFPFRRKEAQSFALDLADFTGVGTSLDMTGLGAVTGVTREMALQVPTVVRARNNLVTVVCGMPLQHIAPDGSVVKDPFVKNINANGTTLALMRRIVNDLFFDGESLLRFAGLNSAGKPTGLIHVPAGTWSFGDDGMYHIGEIVVRREHAVYIEGLDEGLLNSGGASAVLDYLRLQRAVRAAVDSPVPLGFLQVRDDSDALDPEEMRSILTAWTEARRSARWAMLPSAIKVEMPALSPRDRQLSETGESTILDLVRSTLGSPEDVGVSTTSRTYSNVQDARDDYLLKDVKRYILPIEEGLSQPHVISSGHRIGLNASSFTRPGDKERYEGYVLGLQCGAIKDINEVRALENKPPYTEEEISRRGNSSDGSTSVPGEQGGSAPDQDEAGVPGK